MMPKYGMNTAMTHHGHDWDINFTENSEVSDMISHNMSPILKYRCIIDHGTSPTMGVSPTTVPSVGSERV